MNDSKQKKETNTTTSSEGKPNFKRAITTHADVFDAILPYTVDDNETVVLSRFPNPQLSDHPREKEVADLVHSSIKVIELFDMVQRGGVAAVTNYYYDLARKAYIAERQDEENAKMSCQNCQKLGKASSSTSTCDDV